MDSRPLYFARDIESRLITEYSEEQLLETAIHYDEAALGELYDRYEVKIYSYIFRRTGILHADRRIVNNARGRGLILGFGLFFKQNNR